MATKNLITAETGEEKEEMTGQELEQKQELETETAEVEETSLEQKTVIYQTEADRIRSLKENYVRKHLVISNINFKNLDDVNLPGGAMDGHASTFGNVDSQSDYVKRGAFKKTIKEQEARGVPLLDQHRMFAGTEAAIGRTLMMKEDQVGLYFKAMFSIVQKAQEIRQKITEKVLDSLSIGFSIIKFKEIKREAKVIWELQELRLWEISVVIFPANVAALISGVKSESSDFVVFEDPTRELDGDIAFQRFYKFCGNGLPMSEWDEEQSLLFASGFAEIDLDADTKSRMFKHQIVDVVNDAPVIIPSAVRQASQVLPENDLLTKYLDKLPPIEDKTKEDDIETKEEKDAEVVAHIERSMHFRRALDGIREYRSQKGLTRAREAIQAVLESRKSKGTSGAADK